MKRVMILAVAVSLSGCAGMARTWVKDGATQESFEQDRVQCRYEAERATASYSNGGRSVASGFAEGLEMGSRTNDLQVSCMQARGYRLERKP